MLNSKFFPSQLSIIGFLFCCSYYAQPSERRMTREQYIERYSEEAVNQMIKHKIPASITIAQGILESGNGNSELAKYGKNHFGIKCNGWKGQKTYHDDDKKNECFRKYSSAFESYEDHSLFLNKYSRYSSLFELDIEDYKSWAKGLKNAGYATNPKYADILISLIEQHELFKYDRSTTLINNKNVLSYNDKLMLKPLAKSHKVKIHKNNIKYIEVTDEDTFYKISKEFDMGLWQLYKYNDLDKNDLLITGDVIFLQPKRNKAQIEFHVFKNGDSMKEISQLYGLKLKKLHKKNKTSIDSEPSIGDKIFLIKHKK